MHLYAPRAQLLHLNPSHRPVLQFQRAAGVRTACSPGAVPIATAPHPQHCRPLVSTCLFFSNPRFLSKLLSDGAQTPWLSESLALLCAGGLLRTQQVHRAVETILTKL